MWNHVKCSIENTKGRKRIEDKIKEQETNEISRKIVTNILDIKHILIINLHILVSIHQLKTQMSQWIRK